MATGREQRMQERMRGAGRHQVEDVSFGFVLPVAEPLPPPEPPRPTPLSRSTPNTAVKRTRLAADGTPKAQASEPSNKAIAVQALTSTSKRKRDVYDLPDDTSDERVRRPGPPSTRALGSSRLSIVQPTEEDGVEGEQTRPVPVSSRRRPRIQVPDPIVAEEVGESPVDAPGSGQRRAVRLSDVTASAKVLQDVLGSSHDVALPASSPSLRTAALQAAGTPALSRPGKPRRQLRRSLAQEAQLDELSPEAGSSTRQDRVAADTLERQEDFDELSPIPAARKPKSRPKSQLGPGRRRTEPDGRMPASEDRSHDAGGSDVDEVPANRLRRRARRASPVPSVDLSSQPIDMSAAPQRQRRRELDSPAQQRQPKKRKVAKPPKKASRDEEEPAEAAPDTSGFHVHVQRFSKKPRSGEDGGDDDDADADGSGADVLQLDIPFANRSGVNSVDLLAQLCEDIIATQRDVLQTKAANAEDRARKKEFLTMLKTLEAFRTELSTRLLEHTIALDTVYALNKRVKAAQKEKIALRDEVLRLRAEREQVALRMDAVRIKHEDESKSALHSLGLSVAMHGVDLAVEQGARAGEMSSVEEKMAGLGNLELAISKIADLASSKSDVGGTLQQVRDFNGFLERTALALEAR